MRNWRIASMTGVLMGLSACAQPAVVGPAPPTTPEAPGFEVQQVRPWPFRTLPPRALDLPRPNRTPPVGPTFRPSRPCTPPFLSGFVTYNLQTENQLLDMINDVRAAANAPALTKDDALRLRGAAREQAYDQSGSDNPGHISTDGKTLADRLARWCVTSRTSGELIAWLNVGNYPAANLFQIWMNQPAAKAQLLNPAYSQVGIGVYRTQPPRNRYYATVVLLAP